MFWPSLRGFSPGVAVMEAAQPGMRDDSGSATRSRLYRARVRSVPFQREMAAVFGVVADVFPKKSAKWVSWRITRRSSRSRRQLPIQRSATPFYQGLRAATRFGSTPIARIAEMTLSEKIESRSNTK